jgi:16S rRNA processing protein RimM
MPWLNWLNVLVQQQSHNNNQLDPMVVMGRVAGAQGIVGWVKIKTYTECVDGLTEYPVWWLGKEGGDSWRKITIEDFAVQSKGLIAKIPDCNNRTAAEQYVGLLVAVPRSNLPQQEGDAYYWSDLIGLAVINLSGERLGTVSNLMDTGANQVLCVQGDRLAKNNKELLIPFIASAIQRVDLTKKLISVDWAIDWVAKC